MGLGWLRCRKRSTLAGAVAAAWLLAGVAWTQSARKPPACKVETFEGEVAAGQEFRRPIGGGLAIYLQPIASGWIVRVVPAVGAMPSPDSAEVATPPYGSVSPLSVSTDFAFRAQDAVAWNPRRFRFAATREQYEQLLASYRRVMQGGKLTIAEQARLGQEVSRAAEGTLTILDARLVAGVADQSRLAAPMAQHFEQTAHMLVAGPASPLGRLLWLRFRVRLVLPPGFVTPASISTKPGGGAIPVRQLPEAETIKSRTVLNQPTDLALHQAI